MRKCSSVNCYLRKSLFFVLKLMSTTTIPLEFKQIEVEVAKSVFFYPRNPTAYHRLSCFLYLYMCGFPSNLYSQFVRQRHDTIQNAIRSFRFSFFTFPFSVRTRLFRQINYDTHFVKNASTKFPETLSHWEMIQCNLKRK